MNAKIIKPKDVLSNDDALTIQGGINQSYYNFSADCTCNCFIGNNNDTKPVDPIEI